LKDSVNVAGLDTRRVDKYVSNNVALFAKMAGNTRDVNCSSTDGVLLHVEMDAWLLTGAAVLGVIRPPTEHVTILLCKSDLAVVRVRVRVGEV
jgi:hypothetical protein